MSSLEREYTTESQPLRQGAADGAAGSRGRPGGLTSRGNKPFFLTSEFFVLIGLIVAIMIAAGVAGDFRAPRAWTLAAVLGAAYILSRGLSKIGRGDGPFL